MNITAELITSILTQAGEAITCKNLRTVCEDVDFIIRFEDDTVTTYNSFINRFEDDTDTTISIYYSSVNDLISIGTVNRLGDYKVSTRLANVSLLDPDTFSAFITLEVMALELRHEIDNTLEVMTLELRNEIDNMV